MNVDARGAGNSDGSIVIMGKQEGEDGHDVIEELAKMDWCNGSVGLAGNSHLGMSPAPKLIRLGSDVHRYRTMVHCSDTTPIAESHCALGGLRRSLSRTIRTRWRMG